MTALTSQARSDFFSCALEPTIVSKAWVPSAPYSCSSASLKASMTATLAFFPAEKTKFPSCAEALAPVPLMEMSRDEKCVELATRVNVCKSIGMDVVPFKEIYLSLSPMNTRQTEKGYR